VKLVLAPMAGVTDPPFRYICAKCGCEAAVTEMVSAKALLHGNRNTLGMLYLYSGEKRLAAQLFGREPEVMAEAAAMLNGYPFVSIDINMGCPAKKIVNNGEGSALMGEPSLAGQIVKAVSRAAGKPVTVKIRKGIRGCDNAEEIAKIAEANGASGVTVHGRTREQFYSGQADWDVIRRVVLAVKIPVTGNGDAFTRDLARLMTENTGCDSVMIGRGALGNPWIFDSGREEPPDAKEKFSTALTHFEMLTDFKGERIGIAEMRKHLSWYAKGLNGSAGLRRRINETADSCEMKKIINEIIMNGGVR